jgi:hypothetical protein
MPRYGVYTDISAAAADFEARIAALPVVGYNPRAPQYGALGNGTTNDTTAIQNALNDAGAAGVGTVVIPPGTYKLTTALTIPSGVTIQGLGGYLRQHTETENVLTFASVSNAAAVNIDVGYNTVTTRNTTVAIMVTSSTDVILDTPRVRNGPGMGVYVANSQRIRVLDPRIENTLADGCHVTNGSSAGHCSKDVRVLGGYAYNTGDDCFATVAYTAGGQATNEDIHFAGCQAIAGAARGFTCAGGTRVSFADVHVRNMTATSSGGIIFILDETFTTFAPVDCTLDGFTIGPAQGTSANTRHGLRIFRAQGVAVSNGVINWQLGESFKVYGNATGPLYCDDVTIDNVEIRGSTSTGENGFYGFYARGVKARNLKIIDSYKGAVSLDSCVDVDLEVHVKEANRQNVGATNLMTIANQTAPCRIEGTVKQTTTNFTHGLSTTSAGALTVNLDFGGVTTTVAGQLTSVGAATTILNSTVTNATTSGNITFTPGATAEGQWFNSPLTADINVTLSTTGATNKTRWRVTRAAGATGAFNLNVNGKALAAASTWEEIAYAPASGAYRNVEGGTI